MVLDICRPEHKAAQDRDVALVGSCLLPTRFGDFHMDAYEVAGMSVEFICLWTGDPPGQDPTRPLLVRLHSECLTGDALGSRRCDCGEQLEASLTLISNEGRGLLMYLRQEGRGIGLFNKIKAYSLQDGGMDTVEANLTLGLPVDAREYASACSVLKHLGVMHVRLLTNNQSKIDALEDEGIEVVSRVPVVIEANSVNGAYLHAKKMKMGHLL